MYWIWFVRRSFAARRVLLALTLTGVVALGVLTSSNLAGDVPPEPPNPAAPPPDFVPDEKSDLSGDEVEDLLLSSPADPAHPRPGKVYVRSGDGGDTMTTLRGQRNNDWFGYTVSIVGDIGPGGGDGVLDLLVGAPKDQQGKAFVFFGPFDDIGPDQISAANADMTFASTNANDHYFGDVVGPVHDLNGDTIPDLRIRAWFLNDQQQQTPVTYIFSGRDGAILFGIIGSDPFDPWAIIDGDVDGDADVDEDDVGVVLANFGLAGNWLSRRDGDLNADTSVDQTDLDIVTGNFGYDHFGDFGPGGFWLPGYGLPCSNGIWLYDCDCNLICMPSGSQSCMEPWECDPTLCPADCGCAYLVVSQPDFPGPPFLTAFWTEVTILVYPHNGHAASWEVLQGADLIQVIEVAPQTIRFRTIGLGSIVISADYACCWSVSGFCHLEISFDGIWIDSDDDGLPDALEVDLGLNPFDSDSDDDGTPDGDEDFDGDGLPNSMEIALGFDPTNPDSDADGTPDGQEDPSEGTGGVHEAPICDQMHHGIFEAIINGVSVPVTDGRIYVCPCSTVQFHVHDDIGGTDDMWFISGSSGCQLSIAGDPDQDRLSPPITVECGIDGGSETGSGGESCYVGVVSQLAGFLCTDMAQVIVVTPEITEIKGLYKNDGTYEAGFTGDGRVYSNRIYDPDNPGQTLWRKNKQYVDITVRINGGAEIPQSARVLWEFSDPDDPSNNPPTHPTAGQVLDPNDYDGDDDDGDGQSDNNDGKDNTGTRDAPAWWEQIDNYVLTTGGESAQTTIVNGLSKVRFNVTDDGGDNFKVKVRVQVDPQQPPCASTAETGIMTVWHMIQLENTKMESASALPLAQLNPHFEKAFVEWRVQPTQDLPDENPMGATPTAADSADAFYVDHPPFGHFTHAGQGGWFFLASACNYVSPSGLQPQCLVDYTAAGDSAVLTVGTGQTAGTIQLPIPLPAGQQAASVTIYNDDASATLTLTATNVLPNEVRVYAPNYHPAEDNPNANDYKNLADHGFPVGSTIHAKVWSPGSIFVAGDTPTITFGGSIFFRGASIIFRADEQLSTMVHELTHAFGMAHMCGSKDFTYDKACVMQYTYLWLQDSTGALIPWSAGNGGLKLCAPHILYIRRANLELDETPPGWRILGW